MIKPVMIVGIGGVGAATGVPSVGADGAETGRTRCGVTAVLSVVAGTGDGEDSMHGPRDDQFGRGARFNLQSGDWRLSVACDPRETTRACVTPH